MFVRGRNFPFSVAWERDRICAVRGISGWLRLLCSASDTFKHLVKKRDPILFVGVSAGSCSCPEVACKFSVGEFFSCLFLRGTCSCGNVILSSVRDTFVREGTFPWRESGSLECVRDAFVRARDCTFLTGPLDYPESRTKPREQSRGMPCFFTLHRHVRV